MPSPEITMATDAGWRFDNSYLRLPELFYTRLNPVPVREPRMAVFNPALAEALGLNPALLDDDQGAAVFGGNLVPSGAEPIAQAYAGHQFGHFTMLGDGRAILLGEQVSSTGNRYDIQLKGSGQTPFSRRGDGRAALGPMLREYIISEAMHFLGIPTTRSLAVVTTGEQVFRETALPGAILTRVAASHIRVGTFEYAATWGKPDDLQALADYTLKRHYPELLAAENPYLALLHRVMERQATLVTQWQLAGFIHGVMNTDNMTISGETIDYGPCAFMDAYDPATVFSSIDVQGRYAFANQSIIAQWNLARLTEALLPLLHPEPETALALGKEAASEFSAVFQRHWLSGMRAKLGLFNEETEDVSLVETLLSWMHEQRADYTNTFRALSAISLANDNPVFQDAGFLAWHADWQARLGRQPATIEQARKRMQAHNPSVIPRNHRVEEALTAAVECGDFSVMHRLLDVLKSPYADLPEGSAYGQPSAADGLPYRTFCGT